MVTKIFAIHDDKAQCFSNPFFLPHRGLAIRNFSDLVVDPQSNVSKHPSDFKLYQIGEYDDCSGGLSPLAQPEFIATASDFLNK